MTRGQDQGHSSLTCLWGQLGKRYRRGFLGFRGSGWGRWGSPQTRIPKCCPTGKMRECQAESPSRVPHRPHWVGYERCTWAGRRGEARAIRGWVALGECPCHANRPMSRLPWLLPKAGLREEKLTAGVAEPSSSSGGWEGTAVMGWAGCPCVPSWGHPRIPCLRRGHLVHIASGSLSCQFWALRGLYPQPEPFGVSSPLWLWEKPALQAHVPSSGEPAQGGPTRAKRKVVCGVGKGHGEWELSLAREGLGSHPAGEGQCSFHRWGVRG